MYRDAGSTKHKIHGGGCYAVEKGRYKRQRLFFSASGYIVSVFSVFIFVVDVVVVVVITGAVVLVQAMKAYGGLVENSSSHS
jgi:hypothetical protein